jgi:tRNA(Ile)-lysidine synthase
MQVNLDTLLGKNETIAIALSGGADSVALLHYMLSVSKLYPVKIIALNVEHGIRGEASKSDTEFVAELCKKLNVELLRYEVDSPAYAKEQKLTLEQAARALRYNCFYDAINSGKCDKVATAHHLSDNAESILLNLFRGTGLKGVTGIEQNFENKIIRPFLNVEKNEITDYINKNGLSFVTDQSNFDDEFTRNHIRLNVMTEIKKSFPEVEKSISRFSQIAKLENDYIEEQAKNALNIKTDSVQISLPLHPALIARCAIMAMQALGTEKDWEKAHVDSIQALSRSANGTKIDLKNNLSAIKEYDEIVIYKNKSKFEQQIPFALGSVQFNGLKLEISLIKKQISLSDGLFADADKIPDSAVIRTKRDGDKFTKFGGGTKKLNDYLTDKKVPLRLRDNLAIIANGNDILAIFGLAISDKIKVDENTKNIIAFNQNKI